MKLFASRSVEGRVSVPSGFDPTKVVVRVRNVHISTGAGFMDFQSFPREDHFPGLDTSLPEIFECRPDANGRIRFGDVPVAGRLVLVTSGDGLAEAQWTNENKTFDKPIELSVLEESVVSGRVLTPEGKPAGGVKVTARLSVRGQRPNSYLSSFRAITDGSGKFTLHGLPQTEFVLSLEDPKKASVFRPLENLLIEPHRDPNLVHNLETGTRVSGRVLDGAGRPVEAAHITAVADKNGGPGLGSDSTDALGHYEIRLPAGNACLYFSGLPDGFRYPQPQVIKDLEIKAGQADIQNLDFTVERKTDGSR